MKQSILKKISPRLPLVTVAAGLMLGMLTNQALAGSIIGTKHDFSSNTWSGGEICVVCHTPHNSITTVTTAPLWNHALTATVFKPYSSTTMDSSPTDPQGISRLCLSCHDGTVAYDAFGGQTGDVVNNVMKAPEAVGINGDLRDDHPISMTYDTALANLDKGLHDPSTTTVIIGDPGDRTRTGTVTDLMTSGGTVECSSCHDVHNTFAVSDIGSPLLKVSTSGSKLCLTCHAK